ncbi:MBL fold metallo-hydrolase [Bdellovibrio sp. HCB290]|uniref:MBL fold metallo-hydrolase n=1 Tax=Bdellovibrio sp. HCB290 TaxID=3394356 RepID=UPI0039B5FF57
MAVKVSRIFHAGYVMECAGTRIAFDPLFESPFSRNCYAYPAVEFDHAAIRNLRLDAVFVSHYHDDHCSFDSLKLLDRTTPIYMFCIHDEMFSWIKELGFSQVYALKLNSSVRIGSFEVISHPALDIDVDSVFEVQVEGLKILNVVDSWLDTETYESLAAQRPWDLVMWPFQTMRELEVLEPTEAQPSDRKLPSEWVEQLQGLRPRTLIPSSCQFRMEDWSWYNHAFFPISYKDFTSQILKALPETKIVNLRPTTSILLTKSGVSEAESLPWVKLVGDPQADYQYQADLVPPTTAQIASHFPKLDSEGKKEVVRYCTHGLIEKFKEVGPSGDLYFNKPRTWQLLVFDQDGTSNEFIYEVNEDCLSPLTKADSAPEWSTEVIAAKLYSALTTGESLTSLYLRVNKTVDVEVIEDPLIRCLFNGEFGSYQKAQLARIKNEEAL